MTLVKYVNVFNATYQSLLNASEQGILANIYRFSKPSHCSHSFCCDTGCTNSLPNNSFIGGFTRTCINFSETQFNRPIYDVYLCHINNLLGFETKPSWISLQHAVDEIERASEYKIPSEYESAKMFADMKSTNIPFGVLPMERGRL